MRRQQRRRRQFKRPITSALANLQGQFVSNQNLIAAAAAMAAIPTRVVYILLRKQFIAGLIPGRDERLAGVTDRRCINRGHIS